MNNIDTKSLKPGDEVGIEGRGCSWIQKVKRITPSGQVVLDDGSRFAPDGIMIGTKEGRMPSITLVPIDHHIRDSVRRSEIVDDLTKHMREWKSLPIFVLKKFKAILETMADEDDEDAYPGVTP